MTIITENTQIDSTLTAESRGAQTQALQSRLAATYPKVFTNDAPLPLKIGIHHDLLTRHPDLDPATLRRALKRYCERRKYQLALASEGAVRVDLDGQPTGEVLEDQRKFAKLKLNNWKSTKPAKSSDQATQAPTPAPTPPPPPEQPQTAVSGRPILKLKKPGTVVAAVVVTRRAKS